MKDIIVILMLLYFQNNLKMEVKTKFEMVALK